MILQLFCTNFASNRPRPPPPPPGGVLPNKLKRGVRPTSQNPYPIYDLIKNLIPYLLAKRVPGARDKPLRHVHSCRKHHVEEVASFIN